MDSRATCETDLDCSKSVHSSPTKAIKDLSEYNLEEIKKVYRKRKKMIEKMTKASNDVMMSTTKDETKLNAGNAMVGFNRVFNNYKTPKTKFSPNCRPDTKRFA